MKKYNWPFIITFSIMIYLFNLAIGALLLLLSGLLGGPGLSFEHDLILSFLLTLAEAVPVFVSASDD